MAALDASGIRYLVVGGIAVGLHSEPRYTKDLDLLITVHAPDHQRLFACLRLMLEDTPTIKTKAMDTNR